MYDLVIRNGTVVDGSGAARRVADVAVDKGVIAEVGTVSTPGKREIDAKGLLVAPGWVDIHTHYDGQVTWDGCLSPSCWHGVTTVVMGNCGVGFAPVRPGGEDRLINIMEGVEDIPGSALSEGIRWEWESFPQYLDAIARSSLVMDVAAQIPHSAVRVYVMGERGSRNEEASDEEIAQMSNIVREALEAGAVGFSTSRSATHRDADGEIVPGSFVKPAEMFGFGKAIKKAGHGVFELATDAVHQTPEGISTEEEFQWMADLSAQTGAKVSFALVQSHANPLRWREVLDRIEKFRDSGANLVAQVGPRAIGMSISWDTTFHPFMGRPAYDAIADLPLDERIQRLSDPAVRAVILSQTSDRTAFVGFENPWDRMFKLQRADDLLDYEPREGSSMKAIADAAGKAPDEVTYDAFMEGGGHGMLYVPLLNYAGYNLDVCLELMRHPSAVVSLSDAGAHCGVICDAATPTFMLSFWTRDRERGERLSIEEAVAMQTRRTAEIYNLTDRGLLAPGMKADINLIDYNKLRILAPEIVQDLPAGGKRLLQRAEGYRATIVNGVVTFEDGIATGEMPGKLIRGGGERRIAA